MKDFKIITTSPFQFLTINDVKIYREVNEHSKAWISGYIDEEAEQNYINTTLNNAEITINITDEDGTSQKVFCGVVTAMSIEKTSEFATLSIEAMSGSYIMDINQHFRTFQDISATYTSLLKINSRES